MNRDHFDDRGRHTDVDAAIGDSQDAERDQRTVTPEQQAAELDDAALDADDDGWVCVRPELLSDAAKTIRQLIAAAPEMLEALKAIVSFNDSSADAEFELLGSHYDQAVSAIRKAEGKP